ncbi:MAG: TolC family protein, partial [Planctomycetota bacterium]
MRLKTIYYNLIIAFILTSVGCSSHLTHDRKYISDSISNRTGHELSSVDEINGSKLPENISLADGLTEDEAVAIALWNNAQFQADLTALGFSRADLIEAGMISNPVFSVFLPLGPKQMEATLLNLPVDVLWQRPFRVSTAKLNAERIAENLVLHGLNLVRDVMITYTNLFLAQEYAKIAREETELNEELVTIAQAQLMAGDISELEETAL